jgi:hypothetical protein
MFCSLFCSWNNQNKTDMHVHIRSLSKKLLQLFQMFDSGFITDIINIPDF